MKIITSKLKFLSLDEKKFFHDNYKNNHKKLYINCLNEIKKYVPRYTKNEEHCMFEKRNKEIDQLFIWIQNY